MVTSDRGDGPAFRIETVIWHFSPASQNASRSPLTSFTCTASTTTFGSGILPQLTSRAYDTASSGTPLLSPSTMKGESHASPLPSLSWSAWRKVLGMIGGFATVGQSSMASGTPSLSTSSFTDAHPPVLTTPSFWQVSPPQTSPAPPGHGGPVVVHVVPLRLQLKMQVQLPTVFVQTLLGSSRHRPLMVVHWASVEQIWALV